MFKQIIEFMAWVRFMRYKYHKSKSDKILKKYIFKKYIEETEIKDYFVHMKEQTLSPMTSGVALYARTANNANNNLPIQVKLLKEKAEMVGDSNYSIYSEVAGGRDKDEYNHAELYRLLRDAENGKIKRIYVRNRDRFARDFIYGREIEKKFHDFGVELVETA